MSILNKLIIPLIAFYLFFYFPLNAETVKVLAFGDAGTGKEMQYEVAKSMKRVCDHSGCDFAIMLGDNIYENGVDSVNDIQFINKFEKPYSSFEIPFYVSLGNHDDRGDTNAQIEYTKKSKRWTMPARYYDFVKGNIHFIAIDSNDFDRKQRRFIERKLNHSKSRWKVVFGHHPVYSYGRHGHTKDLVKDLLPMLCHSGAIYVSGHDHDLQVMQTPCGVPLVVSGAAAKLRSTSKGKYSLFSLSEYGYSRMEFNENSFEIFMYNKSDDIVFSKTFFHSKAGVKTSYKTIDGFRKKICKSSDTIQGFTYDKYGDKHVQGMYCVNHGISENQNRLVYKRVDDLKGTNYDVFCPGSDQIVSGITYKDGIDDHMLELICKNVPGLFAKNTYFREIPTIKSKEIDIRCDDLKDAVFGVKYDDQGDDHITGIFCKERKIQ